MMAVAIILRIQPGAIARTGWYLAMLLALAGCATNASFNNGKHLLEEGKVEEGLAALQQAVNEEPGNTEYRSFYYRNRDIAITQLLVQGENARSAGDLEAAENTFRRVLVIDGSNVRAKSGIERVQADKRHKALVAEADALIKAGNLDGATAKLKIVLAENPNDREARALQRSIEERQVRTVVTSPTIKSALTKPLSLEFREANLRSIFEVISRTAGINFAFDRDVPPDLRATIFARDTTIEDIIRILLVTNQLEKKVLNENTILIYPNTTVKAKDYQELAVKSFYLTNADTKQTMNLIKTILKTRDVYIDEKLNLLVMRDTPEVIRLAEKLVATQDLAEPEVVLEVEIMEVKRTKLTELGIQYPNQFSLVNFASTNVNTIAQGGTTVTTPTVATNPLTLNTLKNITSSQIAISPVILNLRKEQSDANLLANPRIRVKNREKARIHIGDRLPVITTTSTANVGVSESVTYLDVGLKLDVESNVNLDDEVGIKVVLEVSNIVREVKSSSGTLTYQIGTRSATTTLRLLDGETQVLAGLISDEDRKTANKVPGLGDLPVLGRLFSSHLDDATKTEIIMLITPHIVRNLVRPNANVLEFLSGTDSSLGTPPLSARSGSGGGPVPGTPPLQPTPQSTGSPTPPESGSR